MRLLEANAASEASRKAFNFYIEFILCPLPRATDLRYHPAVQIELGKTLARRRKALRLLQREVAGQVGVSRTLVSRWESGLLSPSAACLERLGEVLKVTMPQLIAVCHDVPRASKKIKKLIRKHRSRGQYPISATVQQMRRTGVVARTLHDIVADRMSKKDYDMLVAQFPRDTRYELLVVFHILAAGATLVQAAPRSMGCPAQVLDDFLWVYGGDQVQIALSWTDGNEKLLVFGQVRIRGYGSSAGRVDFLVYHKRVCKPGNWVFVEMDGKQHQATPNLDATRTEAIDLPDVRHDNYQTLHPDYFARFLRDVGMRAAFGAKRTRKRRRAAREEFQRRMAEADERCAAD